MVRNPIEPALGLLRKACSYFEVVNAALLRSRSVQFAYLTNMNRLPSLFLYACFVLVLLVFPNFSTSQDVMNGGFESVSSLPNTTGQWTLADYWGNASSAVGDPDLYHIEGSGGGDLPETPVAIISPLQGMAVAGFIACGEEGTNRREYLTGQFSEALIAGHRYQMTFAIANGERTPFSEAGLGVSGLGMFFSEGSPEQIELSPLELDPHFAFSQVIFSREWQWMAFAFTAQDSYTHFTCGVFGADDQHGIEVREGTAPSMAYYFLDGFKITEINGELENEDSASDARGPNVKPEYPVVDLDDALSWFVPNAFTPNGDGENDLFLPVLNNMDLVEMQIFNRWGELMWMTTDPNASGWNGMHVGGAEALTGAYVWKLQMKKMNGQQITKTGSLNLIR